MVLFGGSLPGVVVVVVLSLPLMLARGFQGIPGDFCRNRKPSECCDDRLDDCSVPIMGSLCYCDEFCLTRDSDDRQEDEVLEDDCCPDFREVCLGERPINDGPDQLDLGDCEKDGVKIARGATYQENCNKCTCERGEVSCEQDECMVEKKVIAKVNQGLRQYGWIAGNYSKFWGRKTREGLTLRTGTFNPESQSMQMYPITLHPEVSRIPKHFDPRNEPKWQGRLSDVRDQGWCGSSWAFSTLAVTQDRISIIAKGMKSIQLSPQNLLSCAKLGQQACEGGYIDRAWNYLRRTGVVLEECYRYESGTSGKVPRCLIQRHDFSKLQCEHKYQYKTEPAYRISNKEEDIQWEIMNNGPVQAIMEVHKDLFVYKGGVYSYSGLTGKETAIHSVRIIGWGEAPLLGMEPVKYWLVANSWGSDWGEKGFFRIRRGTNESGIESFIVAVRARLANHVYGAA
ncbi:uncharacterized peptidase C1-like protein F26E4.3 [Procambarus clarkii]|uniref:uncharacterized peptidase C1-like protein F26E4.3 n=1 Tax=Procambarus clarkii TaxID=6728 RepID=UPI001E6753D8|nr:uncharacterized peptidase C1-like protein F26E4.3 [Procambarus clarkii]